MDHVEARLIIDLVKSGSVFSKEPVLEDAEPGEGTTLTYDPKTERFILHRYEIGDWAIHAYGFDETWSLNERELLLLLTGKMHPESPAWFHMGESNRYRFDFDPPLPPKKTKAQRIREMMDVRDLDSLRCGCCGSRRVEPTEYSVSLNIGGANRYVHLAGRCLDCGKSFSNDWDD